VAADRYLKVILTIIAIELLWIGVKSAAPPVAAQAATQNAAQGDAMPVVITGVNIDRPGDAYLPVAIVGNYRQVPPGRAQRENLQQLTTRIDGQVLLNTSQPVRITADRPLKIEADRPLKVENVAYTAGQRPGE
jgi:hypothetical protein